MLCRCILLYNLVQQHLYVCLYIIVIVTSGDFVDLFLYVSWTEKINIIKKTFYIINSLLRGR